MRPAEASRESVPLPEEARTLLLAPYRLAGLGQTVAVVTVDQVVAPLPEKGHGVQPLSRWIWRFRLEP